MKKLITASCTKTAFSFNNKMYKQIDEVSMRSLLGPVLAIIMTELEKIIVKDLVKKNLYQKHTCYVGVTLLLINEKDINLIHER